jgi:catechol 2,3-dioxygenase-like lactoylglutathione lyase family enzyme
MRATAIDHVNLRFPPDRLDEVIDFYVDTIGFETRFSDPRAAVRDDPGLFPLVLGEDTLLYVNPDEQFDPGCANYRHVALRIPESPADLRAFFEAADVAVRDEAERERDPVGPYTSFYVEDPFGYTVEFMAAGE